jgi:hypothetical protein
MDGEGRNVNQRLHAVEAVTLNGSETITVKMTLDVPAVGVSHSI